MSGCFVNSGDASTLLGKLGSLPYASCIFRGLVLRLRDPATTAESHFASVYPCLRLEDTSNHRVAGNTHRFREFNHTTRLTRATTNHSPPSPSRHEILNLLVRGNCPDGYRIPDLTLLRGCSPLRGGGGGRGRNLISARYEYLTMASSAASRGVSFSY